MVALSMRRMMLIICVLAGVGGILSAQGTRTPADGSTPDALLLEVQALRAEVRQVASAGIRAQLLVARLQLQEQRVSSAARQLTDAQNTLAVARREIAGEQSRVRQLEDAKSRTSGPGWQTIQQAIREAGAQIEQQQQREAQLRAREAELERAVNDAQVRWADFNDLLDQLDRSVGNAAHQP